MNFDPIKRAMDAAFALGEAQADGVRGLELAALTAEMNEAELELRDATEKDRQRLEWLDKHGMHRGGEGLAEDGCLLRIDLNWSAQRARKSAPHIHHISDYIDAARGASTQRSGLQSKDNLQEKGNG